MAPPRSSAVPPPPGGEIGARDALLARLREQGIESPRVLAVMTAIPRHAFVPGAPVELAYANEPVPIGYGQTISQPYIVALMTEALDLRGTERVLEIGTGSGYQAAVLSLLSREVKSIEVVPALADESRARLHGLGYTNVEVRAGDGYAGWPEAAPFERIVLTAAPPVIPDALLAQLADGGILVAPAGEPGSQMLYRIERRGTELVRTELCAVRFVPMIRGA